MSYMFATNTYNREQKTAEFLRQLEQLKRETMSYGTRVTNDTDMAGKYIIFQPGASLPPTMAFTDRPTAIKVAHKMANDHPGKQFTVCKVVGSAQTQAVKYVDFGG